MVKGLDSYLSKRKKKPVEEKRKKNKPIQADKSFNCLDINEAR